MQSFRTRILALVLGLVTVTLLATVGAVVIKARQEVRERAAEQLRAGAEIAREVLRFRGAQLNGAVRVLAADFGFREAVASADTPTILSAIENHGSRIGAGLVVLMDLDGHVIGQHRSEPVSPTRVPALRDMLEHRPARSDSPAIRIVAGRPYQLVLAPVRAPETIAWVAMGFVVDDWLAADIARLVGVEVSFVGDSPGEPAFAGQLDGSRGSVRHWTESRGQAADRIFVARSAQDQYFGLLQDLPTAGGALHLVLAQLDRRRAATVPGTATRNRRHRRLDPARRRDTRRAARQQRHAPGQGADRLGATNRVWRLLVRGQRPLDSRVHATGLGVQLPCAPPSPNARTGSCFTPTTTR